MQQKVYYQNKAKVRFYGFILLFFALFSALSLFFDSNLDTGDRIMFTFSMLFFGGIFLMFSNQMFSTNKPFLIIDDSYLQLNYPRKTITVPKEHIVKAKTIRQKVYMSTIKHIAIELTDEGYAKYTDNLSSVVKGIGATSNAMFPGFENCITVPNTLKKNKEIVGVINEWLNADRPATISQ